MSVVSQKRKSNEYGQISIVSQKRKRKRKRKSVKSESQMSIVSQKRKSNEYSQSKEKVK